MIVLHRNQILTTMPDEGGGKAHHALQDVLAHDILGSKPEDHVLVAGEHERAKELQAPLRELNVHDRVPGIQLRQRALVCKHIVMGPLIRLYVALLTRTRLSVTMRPAASADIRALMFSRYLCMHVAACSAWE